MKKLATIEENPVKYVLNICYLQCCSLQWKVSDGEEWNTFLLIHCDEPVIMDEETSEVKVAQSRPTLCNPTDYLYTAWNSPGQNTGAGSLSLLQGVFPTQGSNPGLPHCRRILYQLSHQGSPRILEWVAFPFSRGLSQHGDWTQVSHIAGRFFTSWAARAKLIEKMIA